MHPNKAVGRWKQAKIPEALLQPSTEVADAAAYKKELKKLSRKVAEALRFDQPQCGDRV